MHFFTKKLFLAISGMALMPFIVHAELDTVPDTTAEEKYVTRSEAMEIASWWASERFNGIYRPYTPERVAALRETLRQEYPSTFMSKKAWKLFKEMQQNGSYSHTFGALDPVQIIEMAPYLSSVYVSGWQASSTASTSNEPGPDFADYPMDTVPRKVHQLFEAQRFHDRKQNETRSRMSPEERRKNPPVDYLRPIIADADTGHGGLTSVMKLTKMFIQFGAAGIHLEDQKPGTKKCGHMSGKVLVSTQEHCDRLIASRLQADIMGSELLIVTRTDAEGANLLDTNIDPRDHAFILGTSNTNLVPLAYVIRLATEVQERISQYDRYLNRLNELRDTHPSLAEKILQVWTVQAQIKFREFENVDPTGPDALLMRLEEAGIPTVAINPKGIETRDLENREAAALRALCETWNQEANLKTYYAAVKEVLENSQSDNRDELLDTWRIYNDPMQGSSEEGEPLNALSHTEAVALAKKLGVSISWDWESPRTFEGYYQIQGGVDMGIARARAFSPYSDMIWMESASPSLEEARVFAEGVHVQYPEKFLAYNLSPSFNWDKFGMTDEQIAGYQDELGKMGYVWQFITLAGFHGDALFAKTFAEDFAKRKMLAYVEGIQRQERLKKVDALTHQKWSGVDLIGSQQEAATSGRTSTGASGKKSTEHQFSKPIAAQENKPQEEPKQ